MSQLAILGGKPVGELDLPRQGKNWPVYGQEELDAVQDVVRSGMWGTDGPKQVEFEKAFSEFCGAPYGVMMTNGTHTLRLALEALGIGPGDEVLVPGLTWQATASAALDVNATPILVDIDPDTLNIDVAKAEAAITPRTRAIIPVHLYSRVADMDGVMALARKYDLKVLEDCAHQHGSQWRGQKVGTIGDIGSFSMQALKILQTGEGGICTTKSEELYERLYSLKYCGRKRDRSVTVPTMQSGNYRSNEFAAAIGLCQLKRLPEQNEIRQENGRYLEDIVAENVPGFRILKRDPRITFQAYYRVSFLYDKEQWDGVSMDAVRRAFDAETEKSIQFVYAHDALNKNLLYRPFTKKTHKLSEEYCNAINPARFHLPVANWVRDEAYLGLSHPCLLGEKKELDKIAECLVKLRKNMDELKTFDEMIKKK